MTSRQGTVSARYEDLVRVFGEPKHGPDEPSSDEKVTCEWVLSLAGTTVTIYDWKEYTGVTPRGAYEWHVGGYNSGSVELVNRAIAAGTVDSLTILSSRELIDLHDAASKLADWADEAERDEFEDFYSLAMEFENELRERRVPGWG